MAVFEKVSAVLFCGHVVPTFRYAHERSGEVVATIPGWSTEYMGYGTTEREGPPARTREFKVLVARHVGRVVKIVQKSERIMSDVWGTVAYAVVFTEEHEIKEVTLGEVEWLGSENADRNAAIDASPEVLAKYEATVKLEAEWAKVRAKVRAERERKAEAEREARIPKKGRTVRVVKGRKVPKGTEGVVVWYGEGKSYSYYGSPPYRVGVKDASGTVHWTAASNVEVIPS